MLCALYHNKKKNVNPSLAPTAYRIKPQHLHMTHQSPFSSPCLSLQPHLLPSRLWASPPSISNYSWFPEYILRFHDCFPLHFLVSLPRVPLTPLTTSNFSSFLTTHSCICSIIIHWVWDPHLRKQQWEKQGGNKWFQVTVCARSLRSI